MKYSRPKGFAGSIPRNWIDKNLPICPFCGKRSEWEVAMKWGFISWNRYYYRCSNPSCRVVLSIPVPEVVPRLDLLTLLYTRRKKLFRVESAGGNSSARKYVGKNIHLNRLKQLAQQKSGKRQFCPHCRTPIAINERFCPKCGGKINA